MNSHFRKLLELRRSNYSLGNHPDLSQAEINTLIDDAVMYSPSAFNSQSARVVSLYGTEHHKFWNLTLQELKAMTPAEKFSATERKISSFAAGFGTILFFEDTATVSNLQQRFPLYSKNFPVWSEQSNAMLQFALWCLFAEHNIGASLQHYSPLVDGFVQREWQISPTWKLIAQMPFGNITSTPDEKDFLPLAERIKTFG